MVHHIFSYIKQKIHKLSLKQIAITVLAVFLCLPCGCKGENSKQAVSDIEQSVDEELEDIDFNGKLSKTEDYSENTSLSASSGSKSASSKKSSANGTVKKPNQNVSGNEDKEDEDVSVKSVKFLVFSDFHYKKKMYSATVSDFKKILNRANQSNVDFIVHCGDFSNDYSGSPELINAYLYNSFNLPVYGVYGNHELESSSNSMSIVTPKLTNDGNVFWGTDDKKRNDGSIGYYYSDFNGFRFVYTDTNYSYNNSGKYWEHNRTSSYGAPSGNIYANSLSPNQLFWLEKTLLDAANKDLKCIIVGHAGFSGIWSSSPDAEKVRKIFKTANEIRKGTVLLCLNGHYHTNHIQKSEDIVYFDVNSALNGVWQSQSVKHYSDEHTFLYENYDKNGVLLNTEKCL